MSRPQSFLFHIPRIGDMLDYDELEKRMHTRNAPRVVQVIDTHTKKRMGNFPPSIALLKFR